MLGMPQPNCEISTFDWSKLMKVRIYQNPVRDHHSRL